MFYVRKKETHTHIQKQRGTNILHNNARSKGLFLFQKKKSYYFLFDYVKSNMKGNILKTTIKV